MISQGAFVHLSTHQEVLVSVCQRCGGFVAASPTRSNLRIAEAVHRCDPEQRNSSLSADTVRKLPRVA